jgi:quercetin dioxygenase-like cupin family protein
MRCLNRQEIDLCRGEMRKVMSNSKYFASPDKCTKREIFPGVNITTLGGQQLMISHVDLQPGSVVALHSHPHEQMGILIEGEMTFTVGDETRELKAGEMWRIPGNVPHTVTAGPRGAVAIDIFHPVREDYL